MLSIKSIELKNYRGFGTLSLNFSERVTCFAGINGSGKSTALDAVVLCLSWIIARIKGPKGNGIVVRKELDIKRDCLNGYVKSSFVFNGKGISITQSFCEKGERPEMQSDYSDLASVFDYVNNQKHENPNTFTLPVMVCYATNRSVLDIPSRIRQHHDFDQFSAYDNATESKVNFRGFFEWFREREDIERDEWGKRGGTEYRDWQLEAVRNAIQKAMPGYGELHVQRLPQFMMIKKGNVEMPINVLSDGEKCVLSLVGDLACRLAMANPVGNPLEGSGIVLIDEIDLHLHIALQRQIVRILTNTFPNCQFIITTHSPQILGELQPSEIRLLSDFCVLPTPTQSYGLDSASVIAKLMGDSKNDYSKNDEIQSMTKEIGDLISKGQYEEAYKTLEEMNNKTHGSTPDSVRIMTILTTLSGIKK